MSRGIDALIAEKVMGIDIHRLTKGIPHYSTDIAAAWEVVEKEKLFSQWMLGTLQKEWQVVMPWADGIQLIAKADTAPRAICLAALKAKGINYNGAERT